MITQAQHTGMDPGYLGNQYHPEARALAVLGNRADPRAHGVGVEVGVGVAAELGTRVAVVTLVAGTPAAVAPKTAEPIAAPLYATVMLDASLGFVTVVVESFVAPDASESVSAIGFSNRSSPMIAAPLASLKFTVSGMETAVPIGGAVVLSDSAIDATTPSSAIATTLARPATIVADVVFSESGVPVAFVVA